MRENRLEELEQAIGYRFRQPNLLERALTHRSAVPEDAATRIRSDNEQLEYLGDAVLGMLVSEYLTSAFEEWSEGQLSKSRARLVNAASLYAAARRLALGNYLRLGKGEEKTGGREKPALLADAFEALVAAIYLDGGLPAAREFVKSALLDTAVEVEGSRLGWSDNKSAENVLDSS
jgi:ribonuclease-3